MHDLLLGPAGWPELRPVTLDAIRFGYGALLVAHLLLVLPSARRFFLSERWGGYAKSSPAVDAVQNPLVLPLVLAGWLACGGLLMAGKATVWAALASVLLAHYFHIWMRWRGVLRGLGAPGFITYWLGVAVFLLELTARFAPGAQPLALLVVQVDFGLIFLSAGLYKLLAGYRHNYGVDLGLANPEWGFWWRFYQRFRPHSRTFWLLNQAGWATEVLTAVLMLVPPTRSLGGLLLIAIFAWIGTQIRLGLLCPMVILIGVLYMHPGSTGDRVAGDLFAWVPDGPAAHAHPGLETALRIVLWVYLALLPLAHAGLFWNLIGKRRLRGVLQTVLERYTNLFGIIVWRVFSADHVSFYPVVATAPRGEAAARRTCSHYGWRDGLRHGLRAGLRYAHVGECICLTSLFTTLKYYPSDNALFVERLLRYARTVPHGPGEVVVFEVHAVLKGARSFEHVHAADFIVDTAAATVEEIQLDPSVALRAAHAHSPVHEGSRPGSYAPAAR